MLWLFLSGCTEYEYTSKLKKDVFQQSRKNTVDILLVVDDSCSMIEEQSKLSTNFDSFISVFQQADVDWQIGVVTTDTYYKEVPGTLIGGDDEIILASPDGAALDSVKWDREWGFEAENHFHAWLNWMPTNILQLPILRRVTGVPLLKVLEMENWVAPKHLTIPVMVQMS